MNEVLNIKPQSSWTQLYRFPKVFLFHMPKTSATSCIITVMNLAISVKKKKKLL